MLPIFASTRLSLSNYDIYFLLYANVAHLRHCVISLSNDDIYFLLYDNAAQFCQYQVIVKQ